MRQTADHRDLLEPWAGILPAAPTLGADLISAYSDDRRCYHNLDHLRSVLATVDLLAAEAADLVVVKLAAWFHDAVYDTTSDDNEERSALLAETTLPRAGLASEAVREVARLVRLTATHAVQAGDANAAVLCDADLAVLAGDTTDYAAYVDAVRREYAHVSDEDWRAGRSAVLARLLAAPKLFHTTAGSTWEAAARHNLHSELAALNS